MPNAVSSIRNREPKATPRALKIIFIILITAVTPAAYARKKAGQLK